MTKTTDTTKGDIYRKRYPLAKITNAAYKRLLARVDRQTIKSDVLKARIEDLEMEIRRILIVLGDRSPRPSAEKLETVQLHFDEDTACVLS